MIKNEYTFVKTVPHEKESRVRIAIVKVTPGTEAAGTIINLVKLPKGARVLPSSKLIFEAGQGASMELACGDSVTADRYMTSVAIGASAVTISLTKAGVTPYNLASEGWIFLTSAAANLAAKYIIAEIFYKKEAESKKHTQHKAA